ncbi:MAG: guanylate kinase [Gammaproteobacteria bacterium]|nr:guanylate kinase [Gammaproteobacteria bacterium]MBL6999839.1 guanylate kinase [Gammaproteobacteria bacterium]
MKSRCLFTISAPSGAGKTSLVKALLKKRADITVSVSHATRDKRPGEQDGRDYHFVSIEHFEQMVSQDAFLEHARVFDNYYGTSQQGVSELLLQDQHVILEIDWQGAQQVKQKLPDTVAIFILPPSREALRQRLTDRGTDNDSIIQRRMREADREMSHYSDAEYLVINDDFDQALIDLECIIHSQSLKLETQKLKNIGLIAAITQETV